MRPDKRFSARVLALYETGPKAKLTVRAAAGAEPAEILLYDEIGYWGVTASDFLAALAPLAGQPIRVRINSPGGDVFDGLAMYNALVAHKGGVEIVVDGLAASMASVIALAGPLTMQDASMMMIHNAWTFAMGDKNSLAKTMGVLGKIDAQIAAIYATRTGAEPADIVAAMDAETWMTAAEAKTAGYADEVLPPPKRAEPPAAAAPDTRRARARARINLEDAASQ